MSVGPVIVVVVLVLGLSFGVWGASRLWRGRMPSVMDDPPPWWAWGPVLWRGFLRQGPASQVLLAAILLAYFIGNVVPGRVVGTWREVAMVTAGGLAAAAAIASATIVVWNRPSWLVPPHLRGSAGALSEWRRARREAKRSRGSRA